MAVTYDLSALKRVDYYIEPSGSYATSVSGTSGIYTYLKINEATMTTDVAMEENATMHQRRNSVCTKEPGVRSVGVTLSTYLTSTEVVASASVTQVSTSLGDQIKTIMGNVYRTAGSTLTATNTAGKFDKNSSDNFDHVPGAFVGFVNPTTGLLEVTRVISNTSNKLTCSHDLSFTPASGAVLYGAATYYLTEDPDKSLQYYFRGKNTADTFVAQGCQGGLSVTFEKGKLAEISFDLKGATWTTGSNDTLSAPSTGGCTPSPIVSKNSELIFTTTNTTSSTPSAYNALNVQSFEITLNQEFVPADTFSGVENIARMKASRTVPVASGKFVTYFADKTYWNDRDQKNLYEVQFRLNGLLGKTVVINCPRVQIVDVQRVDANGFACTEVSFDCLEPLDSQLGSYTNEDLAKSAFTISNL